MISTDPRPHILCPAYSHSLGAREVFHRSCGNSWARAFLDCDRLDLHQRSDVKSLFYFRHPRVSGEGVAMMKRSSVLGLIAAAALCCAAPLSVHWSAANAPSLAVDTADARIGHPLTPGSVAGVNRRVNRRAYYGAAAAGAGVYNAARRCAYYHAGVCRRW